MGNAAAPDALAGRACRRSRASVGKHLGVNGDHIAAIEYDPSRRSRDVLGLPGYGQFYKGKPITTMTYDFWAGRRGHQLRRHALHAPGDLPLVRSRNFLYDDGRDPTGEPSWWGLQKKQAISTWNNHIEMLAMVEDTNDGEFLAAAAERRRRAPERRAGRRRAVQLRSSRDQSIAVREAANEAMRQVVERSGPRRAS